jgi:hypothetical protein
MNERGRREEKGEKKEKERRGKEIGKVRGGTYKDFIQASLVKIKATMISLFPAIIVAKTFEVTSSTTGRGKEKGERRIKRGREQRGGKEKAEGSSKRREGEGRSKERDVQRLHPSLVGQNQSNDDLVIPSNHSGQNIRGHVLHHPHEDYVLQIFEADGLSDFVLELGSPCWRDFFPVE